MTQEAASGASVRNLLRRWWPGGRRQADGADAPPVVLTEVRSEGAEPFPFATHLSLGSGFPIPDWGAANAWVLTLPNEVARGAAWAMLERAWLQHMAQALGSGYELRETDDAFLLSTLAPNVAKATLAYVAKTRQRILRVLDGIAVTPAWGKEILIVFDDGDEYYRYAAHYYSDGGEFALSSGMFISAGCGHFVTVKSDLRMIEPVIAHELTHACVSHLPLPAWLNEGIAVSTEQRLSPPGPPQFTPAEMHARHLAFWGPTEIQEFWRGQSFLRTDDGNLLSYDLARILVSQLSADWPQFRSFVVDADLADGGAASAAEHFGADLGALAGAILERDSAVGFGPDPQAWRVDPERGAFRATPEFRSS